MSRAYDDIIDLPHHVSSVHPPMSLRDRAAQFAPFSPLSAHGAAIAETARQEAARYERGGDAAETEDMEDFPFHSSDDLL